MYRTVIISVPSTVGLVSLVILFGAAAGYVIIMKKIKAKARDQVETLNLTSVSPDKNLDTNKLLPPA